jgi:uncharacterized membrane-anchored protein
MLVLSRFVVATIFLAAGAAAGQAKTYKELFADRVYRSAETQSFLESLDYQQGAVALEAANVRLNVPGTFYFLNAANARGVLVNLWRNPPAAANGVLGMILPASATPADDTWGAVISFDADGYVSDEDAAKIDYQELLKTMQSSMEDANGERSKQGFPAMHLIGWAAPPYYDAATHKLHWAKEIEFADSAVHTLNYDVRALGRHGVLKMNFVAGIGQLTAIKGVIPTVITMTEFEDGSRYQDFLPNVDKVAAYGIGGLIAGKLLAKVGILAVILAFLKKGWIIAVVVLGGLYGRVKRVFATRGQQPNT